MCTASAQLLTPVSHSETPPHPPPQPALSSLPCRVRMVEMEKEREKRERERERLQDYPKLGRPFSESWAVNKVIP